MSEKRSEELTEAQQEKVVKLFLAGEDENKIYTLIEENFKKSRAAGRAVERLVKILKQDGAFVYQRGTAKITKNIDSKQCLKYSFNGIKS